MTIRVIYFMSEMHRGHPKIIVLIHFMSEMLKGS